MIRDTLLNLNLKLQDNMKKHSIHPWVVWCNEFIGNKMVKKKI